LRNVPASEFSPGPFNLPRVTLTVPLAEILTAIGGTSDGVYVDDTFLFREELILTDGRVFSVDNAGGIITAGFFNSPFQHLQTITGGLDLAFSDEGDNEVNLATSEGGYSATTAVIEAVDGLWTDGEIFVQYVDNNDEDATDFSTDEVSIGTFTRDMFTAVMDEDGNTVPEATDEDGNVLGFQLESMFDFDLATISAGVDITDMTIGDEIRLRYSLTNSSGRAISSTGEPFTVVIPVVTCELPPLPEGFFTGTYEIEQLAGVGPFDGTFGPQYSTQTVIIAEDPNDSDVRTFTALLHPDPGGFSFSVECTVTINCGQFLFMNDGGAAAGGTLGCDGGISSITDGPAAIPTVIDITEGADDVIIANHTGFGISDGGCDVPTYEITLQYTKQ